MTTEFPRPSNILSLTFNEQSERGQSYAVGKFFITQDITRGFKTDTGDLIFTTDPMGSWRNNEWFVKPANSDCAYKVTGWGKKPRDEDHDFEVIISDQIGDSSHVSNEFTSVKTIVIKNKAVTTSTDNIFQTRELSEQECRDLTNAVQTRKITVLGMPEMRKIESVFKTEDNEYIVVSGDAIKFSYEGYRLFKGQPDNLTELKVENVTRYRDGGTTFYKAEEGTLYTPSAFKTNENPTWNQQDVKRIDVQEFLKKMTGENLRAHGAKRWTP